MIFSTCSAFVRYVFAAMRAVFRALFPPPPPPPLPPSPHPHPQKRTSYNDIRVYEQLRMDESSSVFCTNTNRDVDHHRNLRNANVDACFYEETDRRRRRSSLLAQEWHRRILIEFTPRGNVVLFFDPVLFGFHYYSDYSQTYSTLTAVASKYCRIYACMDFFVDEHWTDQSSSSSSSSSSPTPIIDLIRQREKRESDAQQQQKKKTKKKTTTAPAGNESSSFAKLKHYHDPSSSGGGGGGETSDEKVKMKFVYLGKLFNWNMLSNLATVAAEKKQRDSFLFLESQQEPEQESEQESEQEPEQESEQEPEQESEQEKKNAQHEQAGAASDFKRWKTQVGVVGPCSSRLKL